MLLFFSRLAKAKKKIPLADACHNSSFDPYNEQISGMLRIPQAVIVKIDDTLYAIREPRILTLFIFEL